MKPGSLPVLLSCLLFLSACSQPQLTSVQGYAQGTTYNISYWSPEEIDPEQVKARADQVLEQIDLELSNYRDDSHIERFNRSASTEPMAVPESLVELVIVARQINQDSAGCYDLTIGPLFRLWGFNDEFRVPAPEHIRATLQALGMDKLTTSGTDQLRKEVSGLRVDVSSIAQGYSSARIAQALEAMGIEDYLVEVGGELLLQGAKPDGEPWRVAIERPLAGARQLHKILEIEAGEPLSVVTSGTYRHYYDEDNRRYSHILDARTGAPVEHDLLSVTVLHPDPTLADAWSTALLCLGTEQALQTARRHNLAIMLIEADGEGWAETFSPAFESDRWQLAEPGTN